MKAQGKHSPLPSASIGHSAAPAAAHPPPFAISAVKFRRLDASCAPAREAHGPAAAPRPGWAMPTCPQPYHTHGKPGIYDSSPSINREAREDMPAAAREGPDRLEDLDPLLLLAAPSVAAPPSGCRHTKPLLPSGQ